MANKLKDLKVTKVDFVDAGANPEANIMLFKRGEAEKPAPAAEEPAAPTGFFKRVISAIAKAMGATDAQVDAAVEEIAKGGDAVTFGEKMAQRQLRRTCDEIWDYCYALQESMCSILRDQEVSTQGKATIMAQSLAEFTAATTKAIPVWSTGIPTKVEKSAPAEMTEERLQIAREAKERLEDMIRKADPETEPDPAEEPADEPDDTADDSTGGDTNNLSKGGIPDMKIDKSKLSADELAALEAIEKKAGIAEDEPTTGTPTAEPVEKSTPAAEPAADGGDDIYKGLHPAVKAELEHLRKAADAAEEKELLAVAKKYELLGKKPEELATVLKGLKAAGGTAYDDMIGVLDANLAIMEASPMFAEIGKRGNGNGSPTGGDADAAWAAIEKKAEEIRKSAPGMTVAESIDKACMENPTLVHEYEANR